MFNNIVWTRQVHKSHNSWGSSQQIIDKFYGNLNNNG